MSYSPSAPIFLGLVLFILLPFTFCLFATSRPFDTGPFLLAWLHCFSLYLDTWEVGELVPVTQKLVQSICSKCYCNVKAKQRCSLC